MNEQPPYIRGNLNVRQGLDRGKYHVDNSYGNEVARLETTPNREIVVSYGPLLRTRHSAASYSEALAWISENSDRISAGETV